MKLKIGKRAGRAAVGLRALRTFDLAAHLNSYLVDEGAVVDALPSNELLRKQTYASISHHDIFEMTKRVLEDFGMNVVDAAHGLARRNARYFALLHVLPEYADASYAQVVGLRHSYDTRYGIEFIAGAGVFAPGALTFVHTSGNIATRHTSRLMDRMSELLERAAHQVQQAFKRQQKLLELYKTTIISDTVVLHDLLIGLFEQGVYGVTKIPHIKEQVLTPSWKPFDDPEMSLYRLHNAVARVERGVNFFEYPERMQTMHEYFDAYFDLQVLNKQQEKKHEHGNDSDA